MKNKMFILILLSIGFGIMCGIWFPDFMLSIRWIGTLFINLLKLIALPLIFSALVSAITSIGNIKRLESMGLYTICYVLLSVSFAVTIGLLLLNVF
ncbi:MAG: cation:dicarboxylase symporter family transporter, partial [Gammaproteobacteria bacterium]|nr:cation:dicarboxylase symporter family transporter [Gammaproteobacteria bacterium]